MFEIFSYNFIIYALIAVIIISSSSALISPYLVLDEQALIADSLAHIGFTGIVIGLLFTNHSLLISIPFSIMFSLLIKYLIRNKNINGDAVLGLLSAVSLAVGLIIIHKSSGFNQSIETMLVGNLWTIKTFELILALISFVLIILFVVFNYNNLLLITYDIKYAKFLKINESFLSYALSALTATLITIGVKTVGTLLISSFVIFPVLIGKEFKVSFLKTHILGIIFSTILSILGLFIAHFLNIPATSTIVILNATVLFGLMIFNNLKQRGDLIDKIN